MVRFGRVGDELPDVVDGVSGVDGAGIVGGSGVVDGEVRVGRDGCELPDVVELERERLGEFGDRVVGEYRGSYYGLGGPVGERGAVEEVVDGRGVSGVEGFDRLVRSVGGSVSDSVVVDGVGVVDDSGVRFPWSRERDGSSSGDVQSRGRVNKSELAFFADLGVGRSRLVREGLSDVLRGDVVVDGVGSRVLARARRGVLGGAGTGDRGVVRRGGSFLTVKDLEFIWFLSRFRYATDRQLSSVHGVTVNTARKRLYGLRDRGLVVGLGSVGPVPLWTVTSAGMLVAGVGLPLVTERNISHALLGHQFVVNNTAANLFGGNVNVLFLDEWPVRNRVDLNGRRVFGEELVSEGMISSSFARMRGMDGSKVYRQRCLDAVDRAFDGYDGSGVSPEMEVGNEFMWVLFPPELYKSVYHIPDLVVARERAADGSPRSIAVEVENNVKPSDRYDVVLGSYKHDSRLFEKVVWVVRDAGVARAVERSGRKLGLLQEGRLEIVPVVNRDGLFTGRNTWDI